MANRIGRPNGPSKRTPDTQRIRKVFAQYGVTYSTAKVKSALRTRNNFIKNEDEKVVFNSALDVKIAQVRSKMIREQTGLARGAVGRRTKGEVAQIKSALAGAA